MKTKIKILMCSVSLEKKGGVTNYVNLILDNYPNDNYQIKHFVQGYNSKYLNIFYPLTILIQLLKIKENLKEFNPHILHINPSLDWAAILRDYLLMRYAKKKGFSVICSVGGWKKYISEHFYKKNLFSRFFYKIFTIPDRVLVLANSFKDELTILGIDPNKIIVTTMMVEADKYLPKNKMFRPPYTLLFCSRIEKFKGIFYLLDAFQLILRKYPETKLIYVGQGSQLNNLKKKVLRMKLDGNIECVGHKSGAEKIDFFHKSDIIILPSVTEGFPNIFCEALAAGLPFVGTHVGGLVDAFVDGKQGLVIKSMPPDPKEISEKLLELMDNEKLLKQISENNLHEAKEKYDVNVIISKLNTIYQEMFTTKGK